MEFEEGQEVYLKAKVARADNEQALIEFTHMLGAGKAEGVYSIRVPVTELVEANEISDEPILMADGSEYDGFSPVENGEYIK